MTDTPAAYPGEWTAQQLRCRAALTDRILSRVLDGALADLPDVCLIVIARALDRDLAGVRQFAKQPAVSPTLHSLEVTSHES